MLRAGIIGVTGYTGSELVRLLYAHGGVELSYVTSHSHAGRQLSEVHPHYLGIIDPLCRSFSAEEASEEADLLFFALPHGESMHLVPGLLEKGRKVIDLAADFRLKESARYRKWYEKEHSAPQYLTEAVYGLPELKGEEVKKASLVANPGCYPTSVLLGLAPLAAEGLLDWQTLVVDSKSGASGAGRNPSQALHFPECAENFKAYRVAAHQHSGEMEQELSALAGEELSFTFVPHLVPMVRGILSTIYLRLKSRRGEDEIRELFSGYYAGKDFVRLLPPPLVPETSAVYGSNYCDIALKMDERNGRLVVITAIDNLVKGAAGQAVQNMNLMAGFEENRGLKTVPIKP